MAEGTRMVHDGGMRGRGLIWAAVVIAATGMAGLGAYLAVAGLDKASAVAGVVVAFVELAALALGVYGVTRERGSTAGDQTVAGTSVGGDLSQIRAVKGSVRTRHRACGTQAAIPPTATAASGPSPKEGQSVTGSRVTGHLDQVDDIAGDVDLE